MLGIEIWEFVVGAIVVAFAAAVQGTVGLGFNILAVPIMSLINPLMAPVPHLILSIPQNVASVARERHGVDRQGIAYVVAGRVPGAAIGVMLLTVATDRTLDVLIGTMVIAAVVILASGLHVRRTAPVAFGTGLFAGISSYVSTIGGPPVALLYSRGEGPTVRATLGVIFLFGTSITLIARTIAGDIGFNDVYLGLAWLPAAGVGFLLSSRLKDRVAPERLRIAIYVISSIAAVALLGRASLGE